MNETTTFLTWYQKFKTCFEKCDFTLFPSGGKWTPLAKYLYSKLESSAPPLSSSHNPKDKTLQCVVAFLHQTMPNDMFFELGDLEFCCVDKCYVKYGLEVHQDKVKISREQHLFKIVEEFLSRPNDELAEVVRREHARVPRKYNNEFATFLSAYEIAQCKTFLERDIQAFFTRRKEAHKKRKEMAEKLIRFDSYDSDNQVKNEGETHTYTFLI